MVNTVFSYVEAVVREGRGDEIANHIVEIREGDTILLTMTLRAWDYMIANRKTTVSPGRAWQ